MATNDGINPEIRKVTALEALVAAIGSAASGLVKDIYDLLVGVSANTSILATLLPGYADEEPAAVTLTADGAAHTLYTVPGGVSDAYYLVTVQPNLADPAAPTPTWARIKACDLVGTTIGAATANTARWWSTAGPLPIGPLNAGDTISYWGDAGMVASTVVELTRFG